MITNIFLNTEARKQMKAGVDKLANAVKATLGPAGRNVCIRPDMPPNIPFLTKDGVTVAKTINLADKTEDMGAQLVKMAAVKTVIDAGDRTTTSTLLAQVLIDDGIKSLETNANPVLIKKGMDKAVEEVVKNIREQSKPVTPENLIHIATIAANNDIEIGKLVADAVNKTGNDGSIGILKSPTGHNYFELTPGIKIDRGYINPYFITNHAKANVEFEDALILFSERKVSSYKDIEPILNYALKKNQALLVIAEDVDGDALTTMLSTKLRGNGKFCAIKQPGFGNMQLQMFEDIAVMTGGKVVSEHLGHAWAKINETFLGHADQIIITAHTTEIIGAKGNKEAIRTRIDEIRAAIESNSNEVEKSKLKNDRLAKLTNGTEIIYVGGKTDVEIQEKIFRVDDAKCATYAAIAEGVVPGGGSAYIRALTMLPPELTDNDENIGWGIVLKSLVSPFTQIALNAGMKQDDIRDLIQKIAEGEGFYGYNARSGRLEDLFESGIIDPAKVARVALQNACSVAAMFLTTEAAIVDYALMK